MKNYVALLIVATLIYGCTKENTQPDIQSWIITGDTSSCNACITNHYNLSLICDHLTQSYFKGDSIQIDIDNDGIMDLQFISKDWSHNFSLGHNANLKCLREDVKIAYFEKIDSIFQIDHKKLADSAAHAYSGCDSMHVLASLTEIKNDQIPYIIHTSIQDNYYASVISPNDSITENLKWTFSELVLASLHNTSHTDVYNGVFEVYYENRCFGNWNNQEGYVGIQITKDNTKHYGWLKIEITEYFKISIISSSITN